jgi:hypothetical protein
MTVFRLGKKVGCSELISQGFAILGESITWKNDNGTFSKAGMLVIFLSHIVCNPCATQVPRHGHNRHLG